VVVSGGAARVAVIGCGRVGRRRAEIVAAHPGSRLVAVADTDAGRIAELARDWRAEPLADWGDAIAREDVDAIVVCTPNGLLAEIAIAALGAGKHVLIEKPMGRNHGEALRVADAAAASGRTLKVGFNHRYHPALARAHAIVTGGELGEVLSIRARYGHGGRPGIEREWRADPELAGGGHLLDQGVHLTDLVHWFAGVPDEAFCMMQTAFWPIAPLEDNAYALFRWATGRVAQLHVSMTQWKNEFSFEVCCERGSLRVDGLGGSYGVERLSVARRRAAGGVPDVCETCFQGPDGSWASEWADFVASLGGVPAPDAVASNGGAAAGLAAMRMIDALYRSAAGPRVVEV
jgi:predicted dehydrogenase